MDGWEPIKYGGIPEWPKGTDCKSAGYAFDGSNPSSPTKFQKRWEIGVFGAFFVYKMPELEKTVLSKLNSKKSEKSR